MPVRIIFHSIPSQERTLVESPQQSGKPSPGKSPKEHSQDVSHSYCTGVWDAGLRASQASSVDAGGSSVEGIASHDISVELLQMQEIRTPRRASQEPTDVSGSCTSLAQAAPVGLRRSARSAQEALTVPSGRMKAQIDRSLQPAAEPHAEPSPTSIPTSEPAAARKLSLAEFVAETSYAAGGRRWSATAFA